MPFAAEFEPETFTPSELAQLRVDRSNSNVRASVRREVQIAALIATSDGRSTACTVRNVSKLGARIGFAPTFDLPNTFALRFGGGERAFYVELVWRQRNQAGVKILTLA